MGTNTVIKECKIHGESVFVMREVNSKKRFRCRKCSTDAVTKRRKKIKFLAVEYKGGCCSKCGYNKSVWALDFHHLNPTEKDFSIGTDGNTRSWDEVKKELDKCIMVCRNCHAEIHEELNIRL